MREKDNEVQRIEEVDAWEEDDEVVQPDVRRPLDKVVPVRLPSETWEQLRREAREMGIGPSTLARIWLIERHRQQAVRKAG